MGPEANVLHSPISFSSWLLKCGFIICAISTQHESVPRKSNSNMQPARQCRSLNHIQSEGVALGVCWVGLWCIGQYGFKKKLTDRHITDLILENSYVHSSGDKDISAQCDSDTGDTTDTNFAQWPDNTNMLTYYNCSPQVYRRSHWITTNRGIPLQ